VETGDVYTATLPGDVTATYTAIAEDTTALVATGLNTAIQGSGGYTGFTSTVSESVITLTATVAGTGFTVASDATNRAAVAQIDTITISGTVETGDVYTATLPGDVTATYTAIAEDTTALVATGLNTAIQGSAGYTGFTSTVSESVITLTAAVAGTGFTVASDATNRAAVAQIDTITISGTVETGDVYTATLPGDVTATYTAIAGNNTTNVAAGLNAQIQGSDGYAEQAFTSAVADAVITLTAKAAGTGFTVTSDATNYAGVAQIDTITISGTVETGDVYTANLPGSVTATYTATAGNTTADVAAGLNAAIQAPESYAGQAFTSAVADAVITLTAKAAGTGFTVTSDATNRAAVAQIVEFTPVVTVGGETFRITINDSNYDDTAAATGETVATVVGTLAPLVDANDAVGCTEDNLKVTCTASTPGTPFTYSATVVDLTGLGATNYVPASSATRVAISAGTATVTFSRSITGIVDAAKIDLVDSDNVSVKNAVTVTDGKLDIGYNALANSATYRIIIGANAVVDANGVMNASSISTFTTVAAAGDTVAPTISNIVATPSQTGASIAFESDETGTGKVAYYPSGITPVETSYVSVTADATTTIALANLSCATDYTFTVYAKDAAGNEATSASSFATSACDATAPTVAIVVPISGATVSGTYSVTFTTGSATTTAAYVSIDGGSWVAATTNANPGTYTLNTALLANGSHTVRAKDTVNGATGTSDYVTFLTSNGDTIAPELSGQVPQAGTTDVSVNPEDLYVQYDEALDPTTIGSGNAMLCYVSDDDCSDPLSVGLPMLMENGTMIKIGGPSITLENATGYWIKITAGVKDLAGNSVVAYGSPTTSNFTTAAVPTGSFTVDSPVMVKMTGTADNNYSNGWEWVLMVTLPTNETGLAFKFANWASGSNSLAAGGNMRYFSEEIASGTGSSASPVEIAAANTYPSNITINTDADTSRDGIQTNIHVLVKLPTSTVGGSYTTAYVARSQAVQ